jgi:exosortase
MAQRWENDQHYQHGLLVPLFSVALLWLRRSRLRNAAVKPSWWGLPILAVGILLRLADAIYDVEWFDAISLLPMLVGLVLLLGGWHVLSWSWPAISFLVFMMPLPFMVDSALAHPLRQFATTTTTFVLQTLGFPAVSHGTDIFMSGADPIKVAPACSGMGMLLTFFALSAGLILVVDRPWLDKFIILLSAGPIAVISNTVRITITAVLFEVSANERVRSWFHDWAGLLMMPVGLGLLAIELKILGWLLVPRESSKRTMAIDFSDAFRRPSHLQDEARETAKRVGRA